MAENNKFVMRTIFWTLILASFAWTTTCFFMVQNDMKQLTKTANDGIHNIDLRLSRIEQKLGIK